MAIRIITLEREYGCGAPAIACDLAKELGWKLWDRDLTAEIGRIAGVDAEAVQRCDEHPDPILHRLAKTFWRGSHERSMSVADGGVFDADSLVEITERLVTQIAERGNGIIIGRGAPYFLRNRDDVFNVFLYAERDEKLRRLTHSGVDVKEAEELIESVDHDRAAFIRHYFKQEWPLRTLYQMMINTAMGDQAVVSTILHAMAAPQKAEVFPIERSK